MANKKILSIAFAVLAVVAIVFAVMCFNTSTYMNSGDYELHQAYGGDAYTGIQNAAAQTSKNTYYLNLNISKLANIITTISGYFFILVGLTFAALAVTGFIPEKKAPVKEAVTVTNEETVSYPEETESYPVIETKNII